MMDPSSYTYKAKTMAHLGYELDGSPFYRARLRGAGRDLLLCPLLRLFRLSSLFFFSFHVDIIRFYLFAGATLLRPAS